MKEDKIFDLKTKKPLTPEKIRDLEEAARSEAEKPKVEPIDPVEQEKLMKESKKIAEELLKKQEELDRKSDEEGGSE